MTDEPVVRSCGQSGIFGDVGVCKFLCMRFERELGGLCPKASSTAMEQVKFDHMLDAAVLIGCGEKQILKRLELSLFQQKYVDGVSEKLTDLVIRAALDRQA